MADTPLGQVVAIRAEKDIKVIKKFNKEQKSIYDQWKLGRMKKCKKDKKAYMDYWLMLQQEFKKAIKIYKAERGGGHIGRRKQRQVGSGAVVL